MNSRTYIAYTGEDFETVTPDQIRAAFEAGKCRFVHSRGNHSTGLAIDGVDRDTRGECHSVWDEVWTGPINSLQQAFAVADATL